MRKTLRTYEVMLRFYVKAKDKSEAWLLLQQIGERIADEFKEVVEAQPFDVEEPY